MLNIHINALKDKTCAMFFHLPSHVSSWRNMSMSAYGNLLAENDNHLDSYATSIWYTICYAFIQHVYVNVTDTTNDIQIYIYDTCRFCFVLTSKISSMYMRLKIGTIYYRVCKAQLGSQISSHHLAPLH